ncbi:hypothetical protein PFISCL1PPCAC_15133 [Pristionchus fissidentatus]|uniref:Hydrolase n=1 Tax=Pristionchus fissidentatus TaxID=1538716 RepID=A0AAV5VVP5_9BILA|nr:hypothetical protein PFISCL1PPCAC_15133 [Pristionchus fissidentatus]
MNQTLQLFKKFNPLFKRMSSSLPTITNDLLFNYKTYLFDADGTLWHVNQPHPGAIQFIDNLLKKGKQVFIVTNNALRSEKKSLEKLVNLGFHGLNESNIITPNTVLIDFIKQNRHFIKKSIYLIGNEGTKEALEEGLGVECFGTGPDPMPSDSLLFPQSIDLKREASAVVVSDDPHFNYIKLIKASNYLQDPNCGFFITNEDAHFRTRSYFLPGTGCITAAVRTALLPRIPIVFGKPADGMARYLIDRYNVDPAKTIMIGDRLDTDIKFGNSNGFSTCWVKTGVNTVEDVRIAMEGEDPSLVPQFTIDFEQFS